MRTAPLQGSNSETIRRDNLSAILREVHVGGPRSRSELAAHTGLNRSTVAGIIAELAERGLVYEERGDRLGMPGRPSPLVRADADGAVVLGIEIAVHSLAIALVGLGGVLHEQARVAVPRGRPTLEETLARMHDLSRMILARSVLRDRLVGVGVAAVGAVRSKDGFVHFAPNLDWSTVPMAELVSGRLELGVPVVVRNEADMGARAEHLRGAGVGLDDLIYLSCDVGVGGGIITGGRPLVGTAGYAGEVGHFPVKPDGWPCGCGSRGCWETEVGERALLRAAGRDPDGGPDEVDALFRDAEAGSERALTALTEVGRWLGLGIAGFNNVLDPQVVVLGGLFGRMAPYILPTVRRQLDERALAITREPVGIVVAQLGIDAPVIGAAERAFEPLLADPLRSPASIHQTGPAWAQTGAAM